MFNLDIVKNPKISIYSFYSFKLCVKSSTLFFHWFRGEVSTGDWSIIRQRTVAGIFELLCFVTLTFGKMGTSIQAIFSRILRSAIQSSFHKTSCSRKLSAKFRSRENG